MNNNQLIQLLIALGVFILPALGKVIQRVQQESRKRRAEMGRQRVTEEKLRTGRDPEAAQTVAQPIDARRQLQEIAARRQAQLAELRRRAQARMTQATQPGPTMRIPGSPGPTVPMPAPVRTAPRQAPRPAARQARPASPPAIPRPQAAQRPAPDRRRGQPKRPPPSPRLQQEPESDAPRRTVEERAEAPVVAAATVLARLLGHSGPATVEDFRRAVILAEVLGPPVGQRGGVAG